MIFGVMHKKCTFIFLFLAIILMSACTKPEDKIRGYWQLSKILKDDVEVTTESPSQVETLLSTWAFYMSNIVLINYYKDGVVYKSSGDWSINDAEDVLSVNFVDAYEKLERSYKIEKFKSNELKVSFMDEANVTWTLIFALQYSFQDYDI